MEVKISRVATVEAERASNQPEFGGVEIFRHRCPLEKRPPAPHTTLPLPDRCFVHLCAYIGLVIANVKPQSTVGPSLSFVDRLVLWEATVGPDTRCLGRM